MNHLLQIAGAAALAKTALGIALEGDEPLVTFARAQMSSIIEITHHGLELKRTQRLALKHGFHGVLTTGPTPNEQLH